MSKTQDSNRENQVEEDKSIKSGQRSMERMITKTVSKGTRFLTTVACILILAVAEIGVLRTDVHAAKDATTTTVTTTTDNPKVSLERITTLGKNGNTSELTAFVFDVATPEADATPDSCQGTITKFGDTTLPSSIGVVDAWKDADTQSAVTTFEAGKSYTYTVTLTSELFASTQAGITYAAAVKSGAFKLKEVKTLSDKTLIGIEKGKLTGTNTVLIFQGTYTVPADNEISGISLQLPLDTDEEYQEGDPVPASLAPTITKLLVPSGYITDSSVVNNAFTTDSASSGLRGDNGVDAVSAFAADVSGTRYKYHTTLQFVSTEYSLADKITCTVSDVKGNDLGNFTATVDTTTDPGHTYVNITSVDDLIVLKESGSVSIGEINLLIDADEIPVTTEHKKEDFVSVAGDYTLDEPDAVEWQYLDTDGTWKSPNMPDVCGDTDYRVLVKLVPKTGYQFAANAAWKVNGEESDALSDMTIAEDGVSASAFYQLPRSARNPLMIAATDVEGNMSLLNEILYGGMPVEPDVVEGLSWSEADKRLTMNGYNGSTLYIAVPEETGIMEPDCVELCIEGENTITTTDAYNQGIFDTAADLTLTGSGTLTIDFGSNKTSLDSAGITAAHLTIDGPTVVISNCPSNGCLVKGFDNEPALPGTFTMKSGSLLVELTEGENYANNPVYAKYVIDAGIVKLLGGEIHVTLKDKKDSTVTYPSELIYSEEGEIGYEGTDIVTELPDGVTIPASDQLLVLDFSDRDTYTLDDKAKRTIHSAIITDGFCAVTYLESSNIQFDIDGDGVIDFGSLADFSYLTKRPGASGGQVLIELKPETKANLDASSKKYYDAILIILSHPHKHQWNPEWTKAADAHYHACIADDCDITQVTEMKDYAPHSFGEWSVVTAATKTTTGSKERVCTVCGYKQTETIPEISSAPGSGNQSGKSDNGSQTGKESKTLTNVKVGDTFTVKKAKYKVTSNRKNSLTVTYMKSTSTKTTSVSVPKTVKYKGHTFKVTAIDAKALNGFKKLKSVTIGANVKTIGKQAFNGCKNLKTIKISSKVLTKVGKNAFKGISAKAKIKVPKAKLSSYQKLLKGKGQKKTVKITK